MAEEAQVMEGNITVPYSWTTGYAAGRFLTELRDNQKILGIKCSKCGEVMVPPRDICPHCYIKNEEMVEVGPEGTVTAFSVVHLSNDEQAVDTPFALALIRLEGADTDLIHLLGGVNEFGDIQHGMKVEPVWKKERIGYLTDIEYFKPA